MRIALSVVALAAATPALAQTPVDQPPPPQGGGQAGDAAPSAATAPATNPRVDPFYGEAPDPGGPSNVAPGDNRYLNGSRAGQDIVVRFHQDRSRGNVIGLAASAGAAVLLGGAGLFFHLDSRDATSAVAADRFTGLTWSDARQAEVDRAERSATVAGILYGAAGALALATAVAYIVTEPPLETRVIHPHVNRRPTAVLAPSPGGAVVGGAWRF